MRLEERDGQESAAEVAPLAAAVYPPDVLTTIVWRNVASARTTRRILVHDSGKLVSAAGVLSRRARVDGIPVDIAGIGGVMTLPSAQRKGFGRAAMLGAHDLIERGKVAAFGLLFCEPKNFGFYQMIGWRVFDGTIIAEQPGTVGPYEVMPAMVRPFVSAPPRKGIVDLCGLPW